ncbi:CPBP family intramembrane glutamic endopeptidase [Devosia sp. SL43]|uniref:CPBP family intramembrane glutamic endopeptidase n=1 Tax=Devosia sp. SL43 TaxID=2806348 RepID=UPI001F456897|nr:CPBP family intramembrane glutamic endopeptidase [Devosia sp. SL43]UJW87514.1 CPBP family intramembrane metalloprotease [Devosia sp. SL43]
MSSSIDFPYYRGVPVDIAPLGWLAIVASVAIGFLLLTMLPFSTFPLNLVPAILFTGVPLLTLVVVSGGNHTALFGRIGIKQLALAAGFGILTLAVSLSIGLILMRVTSMTANPTAAALANVGPADIAIFLLRTAIQLLGEELMTILPLLAVLWLCVRKFGLSRRVGLVIAVIVSTAWFAAVHLPTYNWNLIQCFGVIGSARLMLTAAFLLTRNIWVSTGAHILNDWIEFLLPTLLAIGHTPIEAGA